MISPALAGLCKVCKADAGTYGQETENEREAESRAAKKSCRPYSVSLCKMGFFYRLVANTFVREAVSKCCRLEEDGKGLIFDLTRSPLPNLYFIKVALIQTPIPPPGWLRLAGVFHFNEKGKKGSQKPGEDSGREPSKTLVSN